MYPKTISAVLVFLLIVIWTIPPQTSFSQDINNYTIAVLDLNPQGISQSEADYLSEYMRGQITRLVNSAEYKERAGIDYTVVERSQMDKIFEQFEIQNTGCTDLSCAVEFGKMLSVERIVIGSIGLIGQTYSISTRIVDVESSRTITVADYSYQGAIDELLKTAVPNIVEELMYGQKKKSRKMLIIAGTVIIAGIAAYFLLPNSGDDEGTISIKIPVPEE
ncbi:hypothetical protein ACFL6H_06680 [Candidatus Latescibacterota bacterium]